MAVIFLAILGYTVLIYMNPSDPHHGYQVDSSLKWESFLKQCGKIVPMDQARMNYETKFHGRYVQWEGHIMRIDGDERNLIH